MRLLARFDTAALRPPPPSSAAVPADLLLWCRAAEGAFAWRETRASEAELDALMRELDGERRLRQLSRVRGIAWRLALKLREALGLRRSDDPWDAGHARDKESLRHFAPRRPSLIVSTDPGAQTILAAHTAQFKQPVRLLLRR
jgi:hypothetical protein